MAPSGRTTSVVTPAARTARIASKAGARGKSAKMRPEEGGGACARGGGEDLPWGAAEPPLGGEGEAWPVEGKREPERKGLSGARTNEDCSTLEGKKFPVVPGPIEAAPIGGLAGEKAWPVGGDDVETGPSMPCLLGEKGPERKVLSGARSNEDFSTVEGNKFPGVLGPIEAASIGGLAGEKAWPVGGDDVERGPCMPCQLGENEPAAPETQE